MKRAGLFGGTFNPIHMAHLRAAEEVKSGFGLDCIYFIPAALPPHKDTYALVDAGDRREMISRAIGSNPGFAISDVELRREGRSYTIDTVKAFKEDPSEDTAYFLIIGMDQFFDIGTWKDYEALFEEIPIIVLTRPQEHGTGRLKSFDAVVEHVYSHVDKGYQARPEEMCLVHTAKERIWLFEVTPLAISSSKIRELVRQQNSIKYLVTDTVEAYILAKDLYSYGI